MRYPRLAYLTVERKSQHETNPVNSAQQIAVTMTAADITVFLIQYLSLSDATAFGVTIRAPTQYLK